MLERSGVTVGRIAGIPIRLHISFILALPLLALLFSSNIELAASTTGYDVDQLQLGAFASGLVLAAALFASVTLHELGHSLIARRRGVAIHGITLMFFGGVAQLDDRFAQEPRQELLIALAGPAVSLVLGGLFWYLSLLLREAVQPIDIPFLLRYVGQMNLILAVFNLLPAFPTDGGRVLRAGLALGRPMHDATRIAVSVGQTFAVLFGIFGFLSGNLFLIFIAFFVYSAAAQEYQTMLFTNTLSGLRVADLMTSSVVSVSPDESVRELLEKIYREKHSGYPVVEGEQVVGCVTMDDIRKVDPLERQQYFVRNIMSREVKTVHPNDDVYQALGAMSGSNIGRLMVMDGDRLVGIITRSDILKGFELKKLEQYRPST